jgi:hypothetical protein
MELVCVRLTLPGYVVILLVFIGILNGIPVVVYLLGLVRIA